MTEGTAGIGDPVPDRAHGAMLGLAVGDAVGTTLEFARRDAREPLTDMVGGGPFHLRPGEWTDDTSMALCLADSLIACGGLDPRDLMQRFVRWRDAGENAVTGRCFDIGVTIGKALDRFIRTGEPVAGDTDPQSAGNGSIMRLAPVALRWLREPDRAVAAARAQGATTHGAPAAMDACGFLAALLCDLVRTGDAGCLRWPRPCADPDISRIAAGGWSGKARAEIRSSGYVVHTLEAALWSVGRSEGFREAVLLAANLGEDADTVAAVTGQVAGALWGRSGIPAEWLARLAWREAIEAKARALVAAGAPA